MKKESIRPILVEELAKAQDLEAQLHKVAPEVLEWPALTQLLETRQEARLRRAVAELQLWLADRQWEREEQIAEAQAWAQESASPTTKP